jgi:hypothetical protein
MAAESFVVCAYVLASRCPGKLFQHGLNLGLANSVWITATHILLFGQYIAGHTREAAMKKSMPLPDSPRLMMGMTGPVICVLSVLVIGLFAVVAGRLL